MSATIISKEEFPKTSEVEIKASLPAETLTSFRAKALQKLQEKVSIDGFRKGHVPEAILERHVGAGVVLEEAADLALKSEVPMILAQEKVLGIATPRISVTKLALGNPLEFTVRIEVYPTITLPDYKKIAAKLNAKKETAQVTDKDVDDVLLRLKRERAKIERIEKGEEAEDAAKTANDLPESELPELDDVFVKGLGYEGISDFTVKLRANIQKDKEAQVREKHRLQIIEAVGAETKAAIPHTLIDHEVHKMEAQFESDLQQAGMSLDQYLAHIKKTHDDLHKEWHEPAEKRAKMELTLAEIAHKESIKADQEEVQKYVAHTLKTHKDAPEERVREYYDHMLRNEAVLRFLEEQK